MGRKRKPKPPILLEWMRAKRDETICAHRRTWESRCHLYKVQESVGKFSEMVTVYYAIHDNSILGRHRKREPAEQTCEKHAMQPLVIAYTQILHEHGIESKQAGTFKKKHKEDLVFQRRATKLDKLMEAVK